VKTLAFQDVQSGRVFRGTTPVRVVVAMRKAAWMAAGKRPYMTEVAERVADLWPNAPAVDTTGPEAFVTSLTSAGLLKPLHQTPTEGK
jgi:hypothetical protein